MLKNCQALPVAMINIMDYDPSFLQIQESLNPFECDDTGLVHPENPDPDGNGIPDGEGIFPCDV